MTAWSNQTPSTYVTCLTRPSSVVFDGTSPKPGLLLAETVERVVQRRPIAVDEFVEAHAEICRPPIASLLTARIVHDPVIACGDGYPVTTATIGWASLGA